MIMAYKINGLKKFLRQENIRTETILLRDTGENHGLWLPAYPIDFVLRGSTYLLEKFGMAHSQALEFKDISSESAAVVNVIDSFSADNLKIAILENGIVLSTRDEPSGAFRWGRFSGKLENNIATRNQINLYLGMGGRENFMKFIRKWNKTGK